MTSFYKAISQCYSKNGMRNIDVKYGNQVQQYFKLLHWLYKLNIVILLCILCFMTLPQILYNRTTHKQFNWNLSNILTNESVVFYSGYTNNTLALWSTKHYYNIPQAYILTVLLLYIFVFVITSIRMARTYRTHALTLLQAAICEPGNVWQLSVTSPALQTIVTKCKWKNLRLIFLHITVCLINVICAVTDWAILQKFENSVALSPMRLAIFTFALDIIYKKMLTSCMCLHMHTKVVHILHIFAFEAIIICNFMSFLIKYNQQQCWEISLGYYFSAMLFLDLLWEVVCIPIFNLFCLYILRYSSTFYFHVFQENLNLVFNQIMLCIGILFAPLLVVILLVKLKLVCYIKQTFLLQTRQNVQIRSSFNHAEIYYLVYFFISLLSIFTVLGYIMMQVPVSKHCGPFRQHEFMLNFFMNDLLKLNVKYKLWRVLKSLVRPAVVGGTLICLTALAYYLRAKSLARRSIINMLKEMLKYELLDENFLLSLIAFRLNTREDSMIV